MGGEKSSRYGYGQAGKERKTSFFSKLNVFKAGRGRRSGGDGEEDRWDEAVSVGRVWHSDEDKHNWVGEPDIDWKASAFIAGFYKSRVSDSDIQTISPYEFVNSTQYH